MANRWYSKGLTSIGSAEIDLLGDSIRAVLVTGTIYTPNTTSGGDQFLSDIPSGARIATTADLASKTLEDGIFRAADILALTVTGAQVDYVVLIQWTGSAATSRLIGIIDTGINLPITPDGSDVPLIWNDAGIFIL